MKYRCECHAADQKLIAEGNAELAHASAPGCLKEWESDDQQFTFCGGVVCPPCYESIKETIAALRGKGVTVTCEFN